MADGTGVMARVAFSGAFTCFIAEADSSDRFRLRDLLARHSRVTLLGESRSGSQLLKEISRLAPDILLLDVRTPSDVLGVMLSRELVVSCPVVLTSAVPSDAVDAYTAGAIDFLLKPFTASRLELALHRARARLAELRRARAGWSERDAAALRLTAHGVGAGPDLVEIASQGCIAYLPSSEIVCITPAGDGSRIMTTHGVVDTRTALADLTRRLDATRFLRTHRGMLVNMAAVTRLDIVGVAGQLVLSSGERVAVAKRRLAAVRRALRLHAARPGRTA